MPDPEDMRDFRPGIRNRSWLTYLCSIVETATTVVCPYASVSTQSGGVVTSLIQTTTYVRTTHSSPTDAHVSARQPKATGMKLWLGFGTSAADIGTRSAHPLALTRSLLRPSLSLLPPRP